MSMKKACRSDEAIEIIFFPVSPLVYSIHCKSAKQEYVKNSFNIYDHVQRSSDKNLHRIHVGTNLNLFAASIDKT